MYEKRVDKIVGIAYAMDMLDYVDEPALLQQVTVERIVHKNPYFVPDVMSVWNLLREFRIRKVHMAIVVNEYGGTTGVSQRSLEHPMCSCMSRLPTCAFSGTKRSCNPALARAR